MQQLIACHVICSSSREGFSAVVGTSRCTYPPQASLFNVCCHSNGRQRQTKEDVKFFLFVLSLKKKLVLFL